MNENPTLEEMLGIDPDNPLSRAARDMLRAEHEMHERINAHRERTGISIEIVAERMGIPIEDARGIASGWRDIHFSTLRRYALASRCVITYDLTPVHEDTGTTP